MQWTRAPQVGPTVSFGQEHRPVDGVVDVGGPQARQQLVAHVGRGVGVDQARHPGGHAQAAHHARVGLGQQVAGATEHHARRRSPALLRLSGESRGIARLPQRPLGIEHRGVMGDLAHVVGPAVVTDQLGRVGVDGVGGPGDAAAHEGAECIERGLGPGQVVGWAVAPDPGLEVGVEPVPVLPHHGVDVRPVDHPTSVAGGRRWVTAGAALRGV